VRRYHSSVKFTHDIYSGLVSVYSGLAYEKLYGISSGDKCGKISFADFLMLVWPRHKFDLKPEHLLTNQFPVYELETDASEGTLSLVA
jgi:hypothetical protein